MLYRAQSVFEEVFGNVHFSIWSHVKKTNNNSSDNNKNAKVTSGPWEMSKGVFW
jgi:hypothetical protein